jgi:hypothetical protein
VSIADRRNVQSQNIQDFKPLESPEKPKEPKSVSATSFDFSKLDPMGDMLLTDLGNNLG